jgi:uncharacterized membrane protein YfcA
MDELFWGWFGVGLLLMMMALFSLPRRYHITTVNAIMILVTVLRAVTDLVAGNSYAPQPVNVVVIGSVMTIVNIILWRRDQGRW